MSDVPDYETHDWAVRKETPVHSAIGTNRMRRVTVDGYYEAEEWWPAEWFTPSERWHDGVIHHPSGLKGLSFRTKNTYNHMVFQGILPNLTVDDQRAWFGLENGAQVGTGISAVQLWNDGGTIKLRAAIGSSFHFVYMDITDALPSDYDTADHEYTVRAFKNWTEFYVDRDLVAVGLNTFRASNVSWTYPPYALSNTYLEFTPELPGLVEVIGMNEEVEWGAKPTDFRFTRMGLFPSRVWRLYQTNTEFLMTSGTFSTGTVHWSHPVPTLGYRDKTVKFKADTDSTTNGLKVAWYDQGGNIHYQNEVTYTGGNDYLTKITEDHVLMALGYEPVADGASVLCAEIVLSGE